MVDLKLLEHVTRQYGRTGAVTFVPPSSALSGIGVQVVPVSTTPQFPPGGVPLCRVESPIPIPFVVHVDCSATYGAGAFTQQTQRYAFMKGNSALPAASLNTINALGALVLQYSDGAVERTAACDLRPGTYQLPPCMQVRASAAVFSPTASPMASSAVRVSMSLAPGRTSVPNVPMNTFVAELAAGANLQFHVEDFATTIDVWACSPVAIDAGAPILTLDGGSAPNLGLGMIRDYVNNRFAPTTGPLPLPAWSGDPGLSKARIVNSGTATARFVVQQAMEF